MLNYRNRSEAAQQIINALSSNDWYRPVVLAIPRGAVPMAEIIANTLNASLDVILVHKLRAPGNPEYAIGAIDEHGHISIDPSFGRLRHTPVIEAEIEQQREVLARRRERYAIPPAPLDGRDIIIVDDGAATGATMKAAIKAARARNPRSITVALGVASPETVKMLRALSDQVVCPLQPDNLMAISQFYVDFPQISDEQVESILKRYRRAPETSARECPTHRR